MTAPAGLTVTVLTVVPDMFPGPLGHSLAGRALRAGVWALKVLDIRDFAMDKHRSVDDTPFGGGAGMVMKPDVLAAGLTAANCVPGGALPPIYPSPRGRRFDQALARQWASRRELVLVCGRFEGIDQRVIDAFGMDEVSLGDFVLSGGEVAGLAMLDAVLRLMPGVMGNAQSADEESFSDGLLEYPHYTRPAVWAGPDGIDRAVPEVLTSGDHGRIQAWRLGRAEQATRDRRPDLWAMYQADTRPGRPAKPGPVTDKSKSGPEQ